MDETLGAPIHLDVGRALELMGEESEVRQILQMAEGSLRCDLPRVREFLQIGDLVGASGVLHVIKGMLPIFCAEPLIEQVGVSERLAKKADVRDYLLAYDAVEKNLERLRQEIEAYLKNRPPSAIE